MIPDLFYLLAAAVVELAALVFNALNYAPPIAALFQGVSFFLSYTSLFSGVIDLPAAYAAAGVAISFEIFWFAFIGAWYVIGVFLGIFSRNSNH